MGDEHRISFQPTEEKQLSEVSASYTYFEDNDVLFAKVTPCFENGKAGIARGLLNGIGFGSSEFYVLRSNGQVLPEWVYFCVTHPIFRDTAVAQMTGTGGLQRVPRDYVENFQIPLPPLELQKEIVTEIESYQKIINGAEAVVNNYRPFVPIHPDWPSKELGEVCRLGRGFAFKSEDYVPEGILSFRVSNIGKDRFPNLDKSVYLPTDFLTQYAEYELQEGDFVIVMVGATTGKIGYITADVLPALLNQNMWRFHPDESVLNKRFLYYAIDQLPLFRQGGARDYLKQSDFLKNPVPLPPLATQQAIVAEIEAEQALVAVNRQLVARFEKKIQATLARVWSKETPVTSES